jgi:hypothetical protein
VGVEGLDDFFDDLPNYPGKRLPKNRKNTKTKSGSPLQDLRPVSYKINGVIHEFYTIGQLARALNRRVGTIRSWESKGHIPIASYRTSAPKQKTFWGKKGPQGRRLYSRAQVEFLIAAVSSHLGDNVRLASADWTAFKKYIKQHWPK